MRALAKATALLTALAIPAAAQAHGMRTAYLEVNETQPGLASVTLKLPIADDEVRPILPADCETAPNGDVTSTNMTSLLLRCDTALAGRELGISGLGPIISEAVVRLELHDGTQLSHLLKKDTPRWEIPRHQAIGELLSNYLGLGIVHILSGPDHLLFLLALVLLVKKPRKILLTETAFTISHSLSFSATALGLVRVSPLAAEAAIALSLLLCALDVGRPEARAAYEHAQRGPAIALVFGLVHGLGFAGGLSEIGLPDHDVGVALLGFGAGVELGQVLFLAVLMIAAALLAKRALLDRAALIAAHGIGAMSAFWLFQRIWLCIL